MMIRKGFILTAALAVIVIAAVSCANGTSQIVGEKESLETFDRWVRKYAPMADSVDRGVYVDFIERDGDWQTLPTPVLDSSWLYVSLTGRDMEGSIFGTRDSSTAQLLGIWTYTTHFVPQLMAFSAYNTLLCPGLRIALQQFRVGDKARVYVWSKLTYSSMTFTSGYGNNKITYEGYPVFYDVELADMTKKPSEWEENIVNEYVAQHWDYSIADTVAKGIYLRKLVENPTGYPITLDSTVNLYKARYFMDGQLLSTNIDSISRARHYYGLSQSDANYDLQVITPAVFSNDYLLSNQIYRKVLPLMRVGEQAEVVATSNWGDGVMGKITNVPQIGSYEPLRYYFRTESKATK